VHKKRARESGAKGLRVNRKAREADRHGKLDGEGTPRVEKKVIHAQRSQFSRQSRINCGGNIKGHKPLEGGKLEGR